MNASTDFAERLEQLLDALETDILKASDREVIRSFGGTGPVAGVTRLLEAPSGGGAPAPRLESPRQRGSRRRPSKKLQDRMAVLRALLALRPELSPRLQPTLTKGTPVAADIAELIDDLIREGLLKPPG